MRRGRPDDRLIGDCSMLSFSSPSFLSRCGAGTRRGPQVRRAGPNWWCASSTSPVMHEGVHSDGHPRRHTRGRHRTWLHASSGGDGASAGHIVRTHARKGGRMEAPGPLGRPARRRQVNPWRPLPFPVPCPLNQSHRAGSTTIPTSMTAPYGVPAAISLKKTKGGCASSSRCRAYLGQSEPTYPQSVLGFSSGLLQGGHQPDHQGQHSHALRAQAADETRGRRFLPPGGEALRSLLPSRASSVPCRRDEYESTRREWRAQGPSLRSFFVADTSLTTRSTGSPQHQPRERPRKD